MSHERITPLRRSLAALLLAAALAALAGPAAADEYDARRAGHPLRVAAYILHPIGVALDYLVFRPAHWVGSQPVIRTIFGHEVDEDPQR
jgi:hypothetical protein